MTMIEASPCDRRRLLGAVRYHSEQERDWYERHEPWLWEQLERGTTRYADEPACAVGGALAWIFEHAAGAEPRWEQLDIADLLLHELPMGGVLSHFGSRDLLLGLKEFICWMGQHGKLDAATARRQVREVDACQERFLDYFGDTESTEISEPLETALSRMDDSGSVWLYCLHCNRFFQARRLREDFLGNRQGCAFAACGAAGLDVDILRWDAFRNNRDPRWPASPDELRHGMQAPRE